MIGSVGTHLVINKDFAPKEVGLLIPKTSDGRVLFLLPWQNHTLVGTTDLPIEIKKSPEPSEDEVEYLLNHLKKYLGMDVSGREVLAKWSGIRPLVSSNGSLATAKISRDFVIEKSASGLYSIMGGKWTSYRKMGEQLLDHIKADGDLSNSLECQTKFSPVVGGEVPWDGMEQSLSPFDQDIQKHLYHAYGTRCVDIAKFALERKLEKRLHPQHPFIEAEVVWSVLEEMAIKPDDILNRRVRIQMLDQQASGEVYQRVKVLMEQAHEMQFHRGGR